jgi:hypothetical protein
MNIDARRHVREFLGSRGFVLPEAPPGPRMAGLGADVEALRPMLLHTATLLARKEALELGAARKRNGANRPALEQWARAFYARLHERVVEAFGPVGLTVDEIAARHGVPLRPADLDAVARAWVAVDPAAAPAGESERASALVDAVLAAFLHPLEPTDAA